MHKRKAKDENEKNNGKKRENEMLIFVSFFLLDILM